MSQPRLEEFIKALGSGLPHARQKAREVKTIPNLPSYMDDPLNRLIWEIKRIEAGVRAAIASIRKDIPEAALKAESAMAAQTALL